jgi:hypothetical protein
MNIGDLVTKNPDAFPPRPPAWPAVGVGMVMEIVPPPHSPVIHGFYEKDIYHVRWMPFGTGKGNYTIEQLELISENR